MNSAEKKYLRGKSHGLKPTVIIGSNGLTESVHQEIERALFDHELIKIRISEKDRTVRKTTSDEIIAHHKAELVNTIGHIIAIYKKSDKKG